MCVVYVDKSVFDACIYLMNTSWLDCFVLEIKAFRFGVVAQLEHMLRMHIYVVLILLVI